MTESTDSASPVPDDTHRKSGPLRRLYDWTLHWAETPYGLWALFILAFAEACFFPIPPDVLLIALCLGARKKALRYAAVCVLGSVLGGCASYSAGRFLFEPVASPVIDFFGWREIYEAVRANIQTRGLLYVFIAALTPIPYCVFTTAAGASHVPLGAFLPAALLGRSLRFGAQAALLWRFGPPVKRFIDRYFNLLTVVFLALLALGFVVAKILWRGHESELPSAPPAQEQPTGISPGETE